MKTYKTTRENLKRIHDISCNKWRAKITDYLINETDSPYSSTVQVKESFVKEMFQAATNKQKGVLKKIFPTYKENKYVFRDDVMDGYRVRKDIIVTMRELSQKLTGKDDAIAVLNCSTDDRGRGFIISKGVTVRTYKTGNKVAIIFEKEQPEESKGDVFSCC